jgi:solute carrier family 25 phosphate transporter 23/24/25/41
MSSSRNKDASNHAGVLDYQWTKSRVSREARIKSLFKAIDSRQKGYLEIDDFRQFHERRMGEVAEVDSTELYGHELVTLLKKIGDEGRISFQDFRNYVLKKEQGLKDLFRELDISNNGVIEPFELQKALEKQGIKVTDDALDRFVKLIDLDSDHSLSFEELVDFALLIPKTPDLSSIFFHYKTLYDPNFDMDVVPVEKSRKPQAGEGWRYFLSGAIAGAVSRTLTAPLDRLRVYFQTTNSLHQAGSSEYLRAIRDIQRSGGIASFWRGNGINIIKIAPESAIMFSTYERIKKVIATMEGKESTKLSPFGRFLAGGVAGIISQTLAFPLDTVKTRMMSNIVISNGPKVAQSLTSNSGTFITTVREMMAEGPKSFFRGIVPASIGSLPYSGISLMAFDGLKQLWKGRYGEEREPDPISVLLMGGLSGAVAATSVYPLHAIRTRMQAQGTPSHPYVYKGFMDCTVQAVQRDGLMSLWRGLSASLAKVLPASGSSYLVYEACKRYFHVV